MNRLLLSAQLVERAALRYTPAGLPALDVALKHESELMILEMITKRRITPPSEVASNIPAELERIIMKALEKDRNRRYETANGLAMDVQRYLAGEAVLASAAVVDAESVFCQAFGFAVVRITSCWSFHFTLARFSAMVRPVTVRQSPCSMPFFSKYFITAGTPPMRCRSSMRYLPEGLRSASNAVRSPIF